MLRDFVTPWGIWLEDPGPGREGVTCLLGCSTTTDSLVPAKNYKGFLGRQQKKSLKFVSDEPKLWEKKF